MGTSKINNILVSGASMAGLSTAWWLNKLGYQVTVVEIADAPRTAGAAVDIKGPAVEAAKRMGIYEQLKKKRLQVERIEFKNTEDHTEGSIILNNEGEELPEDEIEIERDEFIRVLYDGLKNNIEFIFNNSIVALNETKEAMIADFKTGPQRTFDLVIGCDGLHSVVRKIWFGHENEYILFLNAYFSISIVNKLLIDQRNMQMFNVPDRAITLNAYNNKTDIIFCFYSEKEITYDYRNTDQQKKIILEHFAGLSWRTPELLEEIQQADNFYFDKFCQIKMPSWTKGRVALAGDAAYCASPAAGMGASLAVMGATMLADALTKHNRNFESAFPDYNSSLRPFIEEVQSVAEQNIKNNFVPRTEDAIRKRNATGF